MEFLEELTPKQRASIECYSADGARWVSETMEEYCPKAERCLDSFHLVEWVNEALDEVRCGAWQEAKSREGEEISMSLKNSPDFYIDTEGLLDRTWKGP